MRLAANGPPAAVKRKAAEPFNKLKTVPVLKQLKVQI
jgi:hypothetical protein